MIEEYSLGRVLSYIAAIAIFLAVANGMPFEPFATFILLLIWLEITEEKWE